MKWMYKWAICPVENGELLERAARKASDLRDFGYFAFRFQNKRLLKVLIGEPKSEIINLKSYGGRVAQEGQVLEFISPSQTTLTIHRIFQIWSTHLEKLARVAVVYLISLM